jgi:hypothetical protein
MTLTDAWNTKIFTDDSIKALLRQQWEANKATTGRHEWTPPE